MPEIVKRAREFTHDPPMCWLCSGIVPGVYTVLHMLCAVFFGGFCYNTNRVKSNSYNSVSSFQVQCIRPLCQPSGFFAAGLEMAADVYILAG